jgi:predicted phage terminase large subunit-like protein
VEHKESRRSAIDSNVALSFIREKAISQARVDYSSFLRLLFPHHKHAVHHKIIIDTLQAAVSGNGSRRVMIFLPPGSAKSSYANARFAPWYLGAFPGKSLIVASHTTTLAQKWGWRSRGIAQSPAFRAIFGSGVDKSRQASADWILENGSEYMAFGMNGGATGNRADGIIIDDPVKGVEDADSAVMREKTWEIYITELYTRLKPGGFIVLIMTRWHEDDLAGRLLGAMDKGGEQWEIIKIPAIAEGEGDPLGRPPGEMLWPEWFTPEMFATQQKYPRVWSSLYQQRPAPEEGAYFKREWLKFYKPEEKPKALRLYGASDYAVTDNGGDWTVHGVAGVAPGDDIYLLDLWRGQTESLGWVEAFIAMLKQYKPQVWAEESGVILKSMGPIIRKRLQEERIYSTYRKQFASATDKPTRARSLQARMQMGKIYFPEPGPEFPWVEALISELLTFPAGKNDDMVDMLSLFCRMLDTMQAGQEEKKEASLAERVEKISIYVPTWDDIFKKHQKKIKGIC